MRQRQRTLLPAATGSTGAKVRAGLAVKAQPRSFRAKPPRNPGVRRRTGLQTSGVRSSALGFYGVTARTDEAFRSNKQFFVSLSPLGILKPLSNSLKFAMIKDSKVTIGMKGLVCTVSLLLSLPNMLAGAASIIIRHAFATFNPLQIVTDFFFQVVWGLPLAGVLFLCLLILGFLARTRPYVALLAFVLNAAALGFVLSRFGLPHDFDEAIIFLPLVVAEVGFAWLAWQIFAPTGKTEVAL